MSSFDGPLLGENYMNKIKISLMLGVFLALISFPPLHAQTPAGQAPDEATRKITELVHAGKYAEAQQLTTGLLLAYPDDQRLVKTKAMLEKLLAAGSAAKATQNMNQGANNSVAAPNGGNTEQLAGMDKVDYSALIELVRQAQQTTDLPEQTKLLQQFMTQSALFLQKHPEQMLLWQLRAASAISLNAPLAGFEAGQKLLTAGAADSNDANVLQLLAKLKLLGWMDQRQAEQHQFSADNERKQQADATEAERLKAERDKFTFPVAHAHGFSYSYGHMTVNENDAEYVGSDENIHLAKSDIREMKTYCLAQNMCGMYFYPKDGRKFFFLAVTEDAVNNRKLEGKVFFPPSVIGNAAVARWKFVSIDRKTLGPPPVASNSAPKNNPAPVAEAPAPALGNTVFASSPSPGAGVTADHSSLPADNAAPSTTASNTATLHVYRPHHLTAAMQKPDIYVDGKKITPIANGQEIRMLLTPGKHNITASKKYVDNEIPVNDLEMKAGSEYWVRVELAAGAWSVHSKLYVVPTEQAQSESKRMEEISIGDVSMNY